jgi:hypothetical protein
MTRTEPIRTTRAHFVVAFLATLALALAACSSASPAPTASPSASAANQPQTIHLILGLGSDTDRLGRLTRGVHEHHTLPG